MRSVLTDCILKQFFKKFSLSSSYGHQITQPTSARVEMEKKKARLRTRRKSLSAKTKRKKTFYTFLLHSLLLHSNILSMKEIVERKKKIKLKRNQSHPFHIGDLED